MVQRLDLAEVPRIHLRDAKAAFDRGTVLFVDLRSQQAYERSRIPGAVLISPRELSQRLDELPRDVQIIFY